MTTIPDSLTTTYTRWAALDRRPQGTFPWRPGSWANRFSRDDTPQLKGINLGAAIKDIVGATRRAFGGDEDRIDRTVVEGFHSPTMLRDTDGSPSPQAVVTAFIAAMIWGYGTSGYGPYRTVRVLSTDPDAVEHLVEIARIAQEPTQGGHAAFEEIAAQRATGDPYLKYLGPAFGTKFLYFLTAAYDEVETTPVLDAVVRRWFRDEAHETLYTAWWDSDSYARYLGLLDEWRKALPAATGSKALERADVELLIFASARGDAGSWLTGDDPVLPEELGLDELLGAVSGEIDQLATRPRDDSQEGPELLRQLIEWVERDDAVSGNGAL
ncbi:8-oxoguanine DNA glycosylase OGG fold protein [Brachybacterium sp. AOP43-C2-M15]|uniref:8-oxoguanine DNA glycosylase OGG fold protein n=1 Tax=Brachybacterium sp. AOP43-C2-M15 TaxID=3457661 RepID=UPI004033D606